VNNLGKFRLITLCSTAILLAGSAAAAGAAAIDDRTDQVFDKDRAYADWARAGAQPKAKASDQETLEGSRFVPPAIPLPATIRDGALVPTGAALAEANAQLAKTGKPALGDAPVLVPKLSTPTAAQRSEAQSSGAGAAEIYDTDCHAELRMADATPAPPATGNPFAIAKENMQIVNMLNYGYLQADGTSPGNGTVVTTPVAQTPFYTGFKWPANYPANSYVTVTFQPQWEGAISVLSQGYLGGLSKATGVFSSTQGFYNATLNKWENLQAMGKLSETATDGDLHNFYFKRNYANGNVQSYTLGINLVPGQTYYYYNYGQAQGKAESDVGGPSGAAVDFGSLDLDSPATIQDVNGDDVNGYYLPGTPQTDIYGVNWYSLNFSVPNKIVICGELG